MSEDCSICGFSQNHITHGEHKSLDDCVEAYAGTNRSSSIKLKSLFKKIEALQREKKWLEDQYPLFIESLKKIGHSVKSDVLSVAIGEAVESVAKLEHELEDAREGWEADSDAFHEAQKKIHDKVAELRLLKEENERLRSELKDTKESLEAMM